MPTVSGVAYEDGDCIIVKFAKVDVLGNLRATKKSNAIGFALEVPEFPVTLIRADGTKSTRRFQPSWKGFWFGIK